MTSPWRRVVVGSMLLTSVSACTDWGQGEGGAPSLGGLVLLGQGEAGADAGDGQAVDPIVALDAWAADAGTGDASSEEASIGDASRGQGDTGAAAIDVAIVGADVGNGGSGRSDGGSASDVAIAFDGATGDSVVVDATPIDGGVGDGGPSDVGPNDEGPNDVGPNDEGPNDVGPNDVGSSDVGPSDGGAVDAGAGPTLPDAGWGPGWSGYPDATWPADVDVYGGVISSCFNAYAYVFQEACTGAALSTACVDQAALDTSLYTQFLFQPLRECANTLCVPGCVGVGTDTFKCVEACLGKNCSFPLFACLAQGETGSNDCPSTFQCMGTYKDKIFSIANKCFANATAPAQKQLAEFFSCGQKPQTDSCFDQLNQCYGSGTTNCLGVIQCNEACPPGDDVCGFQCFGKGSPAAQSQLDALWDCILQECSDCNGPNGCGEACHSKMCKPQQMACMLGS